MSTYRLQYEVIATTSGFDAGMNRINRGLTQVSSGFRSSGVQAGYMSNQLKAIGTTARYYLAGRLVFGIQSAVQNLAEFKSQLGEIDALATRVSANGGITDISGQLNDLGQQALLMSNQFGVSVSEVETYMQRFQTAVGTRLSKLPQAEQMKQIAEFTRAHLNLVTVLGSRAGDPNELAGGVASMIRRMPGGDRLAGKNAQMLSNYMAYIILNSPQLSGANVAQAAGRLSQAQIMTRMPMKDVLGVFGLAAQAGGSPSVIIRGISQMLAQSLMHPTKPASLSAYGAAGLPTDPNALAAFKYQGLPAGGLSVLMKLLGYAKQTAPHGQPMNLDFIYSIFSRQESVRQFVQLLGNGGVNGLKNFIKSLDQAAGNNLASVAAQRRLGYMTLIQMQQASRNLGISLVNGADWPIENLLAKPMIGASNFAIKHPTATSAIVDSALGLATANAMRKLGAFTGIGSRLGRFGGRLGKFGGFLSGAAMIEQQAVSQAVSKEELPAAIAGQQTDGSRANPYWVIISPLSWQLSSPGGFASPVPGGPGGVKNEVEKAAKSSWTKIFGGAVSGAAIRSLGVRGALAAGGTAALATTDVAAVLALGGDQGGVYAPILGSRRNRYLNAAYEAIYRSSAGKYTDTLKNIHFPLTGRVRSIVGHELRGNLTAKEAEMLLRSGHGVGWFTRQQGLGNNGVFDSLARAFDTSLRRTGVAVHGDAKIEIDLTTLDHEGQRKTYKRGVSVDLIPTQVFPTRQGKPGSRRGG